MARHTFDINQGETFYTRIEYKDSNNLPIDLTYYSGKMQIRPNAKSNIIYCTLSSSMDSDGTGLDFTPFSSSIQLPKSSGSFSINISANSSSLFDFDEAMFDIFLSSGSFRDKILEGKVKLYRSITR